MIRLRVGIDEQILWRRHWTAGFQKPETLLVSYIFIWHIGVSYSIYIQIMRYKVIIALSTTVWFETGWNKLLAQTWNNIKCSLKLIWNLPFACTFLLIRYMYLADYTLRKRCVESSRWKLKITFPLQTSFTLSRIPVRKFNFSVSLMLVS